MCIIDQEYRQGLDAMNARQYLTALQHFNRVDKSSCDYVYSVGNASLACISAGIFDDALKYSTLCVQILESGSVVEFPSKIQFYRNHIEALFSLNRIDEARAYIGKITNIFNGYIENSINIHDVEIQFAHLLNSCGAQEGKLLNRELAIGYLERAVELYEKNRDAFFPAACYTNLATQLLERRKGSDLKRADILIEQALEFSRKDDDDEQYVRTLLVKVKEMRGEERFQLFDELIKNSTSNHSKVSRCCIAVSEAVKISNRCLVDKYHNLLRTCHPENDVLLYFSQSFAQYAIYLCNTGCERSKIFTLIDEMTALWVRSFLAVENSFDLNDVQEKLRFGIEFSIYYYIQNENYAKPVFLSIMLNPLDRLFEQSREKYVEIIASVNSDCRVILRLIADNIFDDSGILYICNCNSHMYAIEMTKRTKSCVHFSLVSMHVIPESSKRVSFDSVVKGLERQEGDSLSFGSFEHCFDCFSRQVVEACESKKIIALICDESLEIVPWRLLFCKNGAKSSFLGFVEAQNLVYVRQRNFSNNNSDNIACLAGCGNATSAGVTYDFESEILKIDEILCEGNTYKSCRIPCTLIRINEVNACIVHLSTHGIIDSQGRACMHFENGEFYYGESIGWNPLLVVLSACYSARSCFYGDSVARQLQKSSGSYVIAFAKKVNPLTSCDFFIRYYRCLLRSNNVQTAFAESFFELFEEKQAIAKELWHMKFLI